MLKYYYTTPLEDWVHTLYERNGIYSTEDLDEEIIADSLNILLSNSESESHYIVTDFFNMIVVDSRLSYGEQREVFFHELCHVLRHSGRQTMMPNAFRELQEAQTKNFQLYATMPFSMIRNLVLPNYETEIIAFLSDRFKVSYNLAALRLEQIKRRVFQSKLDNNIRSLEEKRTRKADPSNWSTETKLLLQTAVERKLVKEGAF
ncbi:MAG: ImmA/IrrE family metallo-endopeptidase [Bacillaceae bacterium]|nr:ImmA/IrrE family metallo-endopeptidase [Bacillaceae bacterium]